MQGRRQSRDVSERSLDRLALVGVETGELDQIVAKMAKNILADVAGRIDGGNETGEGAVEIRHDAADIAAGARDASASQGENGSCA
jgi:hypothetical protein